MRPRDRARPGGHGGGPGAVTSSWVGTLVAALALLALSCASSSQLARRSEEALGAHDYERAFKQACASLDKDPGNGRARMALSAAASNLIDDRERRIANMVAVDTLAAADACLALEDLRAKALRYGATLPEHPEFAARAARIRLGAAGPRLRRDGRLRARGARPRPGDLARPADRREADRVRPLQHAAHELGQRPLPRNDLAQVHRSRQHRARGGALRGHPVRCRGAL